MGTLSGLDLVTARGRSDIDACSWFGMVVDYDESDVLISHNTVITIRCQGYLSTIADTYLGGIKSSQDR